MSDHRTRKGALEALSARHDKPISEILDGIQRGDEKLRAEYRDLVGPNPDGVVSLYRIAPRVDGPTVAERLADIARRFRAGTFHPARKTDELVLCELLPVALDRVMSLTEQNGDLLIIGLAGGDSVIVWYRADPFELGYRRITPTPPAAPAPAPSIEAEAVDIVRAFVRERAEGTLTPSLALITRAYDLLERVDNE